MGNIKWISISTDIFNDEKMCAIESLPDGLSIELVWFKLLCLAGTCNESGFLMISKEIPYTDEMMAKLFRLEISLVQRSLEVFQRFGMVEVVEDIYMISNWMKYQNTAELEHIKSLNRERQRKFREKQKQIALNESNVTVTLQNNVISNDFCSICNMSFIDIYKDIVSYLNEKAETSYRASTKKTQTLIHARIDEGFVIKDFHTVIDKKVAEWKGTEMERYLRPETLFGTKFEGYLNQKSKYETKPKDEVPDKYKGYEKVTLDDM